MCFWYDIHTYMEVLDHGFYAEMCPQCVHFRLHCWFTVLPADSICDWCKKPELLEINAYFLFGYEKLEYWSGFINEQNVYINHKTTQIISVGPHISWAQKGSYFNLRTRENSPGPINIFRKNRRVLQLKITNITLHMSLGKCIKMIPVSLTICIFAYIHQITAVTFWRER